MMAAIGADSQPLINLAKKLGKLASCMGSDLTAKTQLHVAVKGLLDCYLILIRFLHECTVLVLYY